VFFIEERCQSLRIIQRHQTRETQALFKSKRDAEEHALLAISIST